MAHLAKGDQACAFCGQIAPCFYLGGQRHGCFDCLREGRLTFSHDTEIGFVSPQGVRRLYRDQRKVPDSFNRGAFTSLLQTPQFTSWQEPRWLAHCDDFMTYLGEWKPQEFRRQDHDGDGRKLFLAMTAEDSARLWDDATPQGSDGTRRLVRHLLRLPVPPMRQAPGVLGLPLTRGSGQPRPTGRSRRVGHRLVPRPPHSPRQGQRGGRSFPRPVGHPLVPNGSPVRPRRRLLE